MELHSKGPEPTDVTEKTSIQPASHLDRVCTVVAGTSNVMCKLVFKAEPSMIICDQLACALDGSLEVTTLELIGRVGTRVGDGCENSHLRPKALLIYILVTTLNQRQRSFERCDILFDLLWRCLVSISDVKKYGLPM
jgi:hypothetical protein